METYQLTSKKGEKIYLIKAENLIEAIRMFSEMKRLNSKDLLEIYDVTKKND